MIEPNQTYRHSQHPTDTFSRYRIEALEKENKALRKQIETLTNKHYENS